jgi:Ca2+-binding RTX toxin-like protein
MRTLTLLALTTAVLSVPTVPAWASADSCQGHTATHVGTPGASLVGTPERDVVVTNGAASASTGEGDDLVCVTGDTGEERRVKVDTGGGSDEVEVTGGDNTFVVLGAGDDVFVGGRHEDTVHGGEIDPFYQDHLDVATDSIVTGPGDDAAVSGADDQANLDEISLGAGDDYANVSGSSAHRVDGGAGDNTLRLQTSGEVGDEAWLLSTSDGALTRNGVRHFTWADFSGFDLKHVGYSLPLHVAGSSRDEHFLADGRGSDAGPVDIAAGKGDDLVAVGSDQRSDLDGGPGRDRLVVDSGSCAKGSLTVDLRGERTRTKCDGTRSFWSRRFEDVTVAGFGATAVVGTTAANRVQVSRSCAIRVVGDGGDDRLQLRGYALVACGAYGVPEAAALLEGGAGDDLLVGGRYADELIGGPGRDTARGRGGVDICVAEVRRGCERR